MPSKIEIAAAKKAAKRKLRNFNQNREKKSTKKEDPQIEEQQEKTAIFEKKIYNNTSEVIGDCELPQIATKIQEHNDSTNAKNISKSDLESNDEESLLENERLSEILSEITEFPSKTESDNQPTDFHSDNVETIVNDITKDNLHAANSEVPDISFQTSDALNGLAVNNVHAFQTDNHYQLITSQLEETQQAYSHSIKELSSLQQQLQVQMQTIGILVAEKQELQHQLHEMKSSVERSEFTRQQNNEQLQTYRVQIQNLEREMSASVSNIGYLNTVNSTLEMERNNLKTSLNEIQRANEENKIYVNELSQKLANKDVKCNTLTDEVNDLNEKLSMAEVLLQQMLNKNGEDVNSELEQLQNENKNLNQKLVDYQRIFDELTNERDQLSKQSGEVHAQFSSQLNELTIHAMKLDKENKDFSYEKSELLSELQNFKDSSNTEDIQSTVSSMKAQIDELTSQLHQINQEKTQLIEQLQIQMKNNEHLARLNKTHVDQLDELNSSINENVISRDEYQRLLIQTQSDQSTISRALQQNKQLKNQLEEMQEGFIKLTNDKMALSDSVNSFQHSNSELEAKLKIANVELENLNSQLQEQSLAEVPEQESPRIHEIIQEQLNTSQETIDLLGEENSELKKIVTTLQNEVDLRGGDDLEVSNLKQMVDELTAERNAIKTKLEDSVSTETENENMKLLQDKFSVVMKQKVDAINRIEDLEHINLQLQNECDTIGEYITLYHNQRQLLKQRHHEKDEYVSSMALDRQRMQEKLEKLQRLVIRLLNNRSDALPNDVEIANFSKDTESMDWPDMIDNPKPQLSKPDILPDSVNANKAMELPGRTINCSDDSVTANEIIDLIEEMQAPTHYNSNDVPYGFCLKYMGQYNDV